ncbi:conserved hypothetical protein, partial [Trichinella spiralis]|uniref:hypothetical protein n=1 Tax=Trichinella spiralis TaxID=6334 RepID=UPI0001EFF00D
ELVDQISDILLRFKILPGENMNWERAGFFIEVRSSFYFSWVNGKFLLGPEGRLGFWALWLTPVAWLGAKRDQSKSICDCKKALTELFYTLKCTNRVDKYWMCAETGPTINSDLAEHIVEVPGAATTAEGWRTCRTEELAKLILNAQTTPLSLTGTS